MEKPIVIFRTKGNILMARDMNKVILAEKVIRSEDFKEAKMNDLMGFKISSGSDYTVIEATAIKDNLKTFMELAFGSADNEVKSI